MNLLDLFDRMMFASSSNYWFGTGAATFPQFKEGPSTFLKFLYKTKTEELVSCPHFLAFAFHEAYFLWTAAFVHLPLNNANTLAATVPLHKHGIDASLAVTLAHLDARLFAAAMYTSGRLMASRDAVALAEVMGAPSSYPHVLLTMTEDALLTGWRAATLATMNFVFDSAFAVLVNQSETVNTLDAGILIAFDFLPVLPANNSLKYNSNVFLAVLLVVIGTIDKHLGHKLLMIDALLSLMRWRTFTNVF